MILTCKINFKLDKLKKEILFRNIRHDANNFPGFPFLKADHHRVNT